MESQRSARHHDMVHMKQSEDCLWELVLCLYCGPGDWTTVIRLRGKCLLFLRHHVDPKSLHFYKIAELPFVEVCSGVGKQVLRRG